MAERKHLSDTTLRALKPAKTGTRYEIMDAGFPQFGVRVYDKADRKGKAARVVFFLLTRFPGSSNPTRRALGRYPQLSLADARKKAADWLALIAEGVDPRDHEEQVREEAERARADAERAKADKTRNSFKAVAEGYIAGRTKKRRADVDAQEIRRLLIPELGSTPVAAIAPRDVRQLIDKIKVRSPYDARNAWGHLSGIFKTAVHDELIAASPLASLDKRKVFENVKIARRTRVLEGDEIRGLWRAGERLPYPIGPAYRLMLLTGVRLNEAADAAWSEIHPELRRLIRKAKAEKKKVDWSVVDAKVKTWTVSPERFKSGEDDVGHLVMLSDEALRVLETLPQIAGCDYLFTVNGKTPVWLGNKYKRRVDAHMVRTLKALARVRGDDPEKVALRPWVNHDLRRVLRSNLSALRVEDHVAELMIGHGRKGLQRVYDQHKYAEQMLDAANAWAHRLRDIAAPPSPAPNNVTKLAKARKRKAA